MPVSHACLRGAAAVRFVLLGLLVCAMGRPVVGQDPDPQAVEGLANGRMEEGAVGQPPAGWRFTSNSGGTAVLRTDEPFEGAQSVFVDATVASQVDRPFTNLMQSFDATPWHGKRVRFRGAVRVEESISGSVQLWVRVDRPDGQTGAFDNMGDRPIQTSEWTHHDIVLHVADDAERIVCGMFIIGRASAWLDDVSIEEVGADQPTTGGENRTSRRQIPPAVAKALAEAADAPQQPFFTPWLLLPLFAIAMFVLAFWSRRPRGVDAPDDAEAPAAGPRRGPVRRFAAYFAIAYWLLYCLPGPFVQLLGALSSVLQDVGVAPQPWIGSIREFLSGNHTSLDKDAVAFTGSALFGIDGELTPPNGSGDTTFNYIAVFNRFALAVVLATVWSLIARRGRSLDILMDLLRSYLRYVLAFAMLGYGLAKVRMEGNQFPVVGSWQLTKTWGDSSPMNVVWSFMGSSRPYTIFAGLGEVLAAVLLIWRRTSTVGAFVAIAVMTNVVMINFCYDVPVKLYSSHLLMMGVLVALPDVRRIWRLIVLNRAVATNTARTLWAIPSAKWACLPIKAVVIVLGFGLPLWKQAVDSYEYLSEPPPAAEADAAPQTQPLLLRRGFRWINEVPFNR